MTFARRLRPAALLLIGAAALPALAVAADTIVIGQSLDLGVNANVGYRARAAVQAYVESVNATGGVQGRKLELVALDDGGKPAQHAINVRKLVQENHAVAILNCQDDATCRAGATVAAELKVPLIGPLSGADAVSRLQNPMVFPVRAGYAREADALAKQLAAIGCFRIALLTDDAADSEPVAALKKALAAGNQQVETIRVPAVDAKSGEALMARLAKGKYHAALMDLSITTVEALFDLELNKRPEWPRVLVSMANGSLQSVIGAFNNRMVGFTSVVPSPDSTPSPLTREFARNIERYSTGQAATFTGMEAYISAKVLVEGLKRAGPKASPERLAAALNGLTDLDLGGFTVSFAPGRPSGSTWVDIGVRSRNGVLLR